MTEHDDVLRAAKGSRRRALAEPEAEAKAPALFMTQGARSAPARPQSTIDDAIRSARRSARAVWTPNRVPDRPVFVGFGAERFRRALARAYTGAGVALFSPHDLRHRRISLLHAQGLSWARIGEAVGHADLMTTARTYTHVLADEAELDYEALLAV